jgi:hypothetical protein
MASYARYRDIHLWTGLILMIPVTVIATTGFLWNHEKVLGIKKNKPLKSARQEASTVLSGSLDAPVEPSLRVRSGLWQEQAASVESALVAAREAWGADATIEKIELKHEPDYGLVVKMKVPEDSRLEPEEIVWSAVDQAVISGKNIPKEKKGGKADAAETDWAKLVHDLHTGKFFSKNWGFLWSDSGATAIILLAVTGLILYALPFLKKRNNRRRRGVQPSGCDASVDPVTVARGVPAPTAAPAETEAVSC